METLAQYNDRKQRELKLIRDAPQAKSLPRIGRQGDLADEKWAVFRSQPMFSKFAAFPETNWTKSGSIELGCYQFDYEYQRFDLGISAPPIYPMLGAAAQTIYTCSGMAALSAIVAALNRITHSEVPFYSVADAYFETQHLVRHYADRLDLRIIASFRDLPVSTDDQYLVVHVDSICAQGPDELWDRLSDRVVLAVFDTTCLARTDQRIQDTVDAFLALGIPTVLVRSHLKLDSLGLEVGRLGSVQLHRSTQCGKVQEQVSEAVAHLLPDVVRLFGTSASIDRFFVVDDERELLNLSAQRAKRISENCAALADELDSAMLGVEVRRYQHGMFLTLHDSDWTTAKQAKRIAEEVAAQCYNVGCQVTRATSFGFDFTVVTDVFDVPSGKFCLRLAPSDEVYSRFTPLSSIVSKSLIK